MFVRPATTAATNRKGISASIARKHREMGETSSHNDLADDDDDEIDSYMTMLVDEPQEGEDGTEPSSSASDVEAKKKKDGGNNAVVESESVVVHQAEVMTFVILLYAAAGLGVAVRLLTKDMSSKDYEAAFQVHSNNLIGISKARISEAGALLNTLAASFQSFASNDEESTFLTIPDFVARTEPTLFETEADMISWCPIVPMLDASDWNAYSEANMRWADEESQGGSVEWMPLDPSGAAHEDMLMPQWQFAPLQEGQLNRNRFESTEFVSAFDRVQESGQGELSSSFLETGVPCASLLVPTRTIKNSTKISGILELRLSWEKVLSDALPQDLKELIVVVSDTCGAENTFYVSGGNATFNKEGALSRKHPYQNKKHAGPVANIGSTCEFTVTVHATEEFEKHYDNNESMLYMILVMAVFFVMIVAFLIYAWTVRSRQKTVMGTVEKTTAIVSSIFPENVQDRIYSEAKSQIKQEKKSSMGPVSAALQNLMGGVDDGNRKNGKPIADLFTDCTIMFADIVGFTAWSSAREPSQVFTLLETIYQHFDEIAARRRVFKVETVGDCYVCVAGLPEPRKDHAVAMARFSFDCLNRFNGLVKQLVVELGPDTEDLMIRIGLHSGPVTAGVLRGERARFQLFGDTVNTTARMESTGVPNAIQVSPETGKLLVDAGKSQWLKTREDRIVAKGKGEMETFWLDLDLGPEAAPPRSDNSSDSGVLRAAGRRASEFESSDDSEGSMQGREPVVQQNRSEQHKHLRLVAWNVDVLAKSLVQIIARRNIAKTPMDDRGKLQTAEAKIAENRLVLNEVEEIVKLPGFTGKSTATSAESELPMNVREQLHDYVRALAAMYNDNPFHNFEHASHVTMSVCKLLSRIVAPDNEKASCEESLHDHTYGITSDPLTQFAVILSALIHDVDHPGIPNAQLVKEGGPMAAAYEKKSVAEQNSVDLAWKLLMMDEYEDLRKAIYVNESELLRFRQLIVNVVMATDIMDKELKALRNKRWDRAFSTEAPVNCTELGTVNRKATIVLEHLIQASDVAHTMQHWNIYRKWNARLFMEVYKAYKEGRAEKDPAENWYRGEIGFFDFYIIPLAKKLKDCGVFGVSSDEYLNYAVQNRAEWERKGQMIVAEYIDVARREWGDR